MSFWKNIIEESKKLENKLDVKKRFPNYFNVWVFRGAIVFMIILLFYIIVETNIGTETQIYVHCPKDSFKEQCENPYYNPYGGCLYEGVTPDFCAKQYMYAGETYGIEPNFWIQNFTFLGLIVTLMAFIINHLLYVRRKGKWYYSK